MLTHRANVGNRHSRKVQLQSVSATQKQGTHFMRHSLALSDSINSVHPLSFLCPTSALIRFFGFLFLVLFPVLGAFLAVGWLCSGSVLRSRSSRVHRKKLEESQIYQKFTSSHTNSSPSSNSTEHQCHLENCFAHGVA